MVDADEGFVYKVEELYHDARSDLPTMRIRYLNGPNRNDEEVRVILQEHENDIVYEGSAEELEIRIINDELTLARAYDEDNRRTLEEEMMSE